MTLKEILENYPLSQDFKAMALCFDNLCNTLADVTERESTTFFTEGVGCVSGLSARKTVLLESFEEQAEQVFEAIRDEAPDYTDLQRYFICRLDDLQDKLKVNTSLQLHAVGKMQGQILGQEVYEQCH